MSPTAEVNPICAYIAERTGSSLSKQQLFRLNEAVGKRIGTQSAELYLAHLKSRGGALELAELMAAVSVHKTDLFRDEGQLEAVRSFALLPKARENRPLRVWSAGCATGEEVATLLILLTEAGAHPDSTVLGTDISGPALKTASALTFTADVVRRVPPVLRGRYFHEGKKGSFQLVQPLKERASFERHNLMDLPYPLPAGGGGFDLVFCRNVLIYFSEAAFEKTINALSERLRPHGVLVLSAAEPILGVRQDLELVRHAQSFMYVKRGPNPVAEPPPPRPSAPRPSAPFAYPRTITGEFRVAPAVGMPAPPAPAHRANTGEQPIVRLSDHHDDGEKLFQLVLEWAAAGQPDSETEQGLKRCLYLSPELACARYLLALLFEQRGARADAASEYRRALQTLKAGKAIAAPFFLNNTRLEGVCERALDRLGYRER